jgi:hypothetical protein
LAFLAHSINSKTTPTTFKTYKNCGFHATQLANVEAKSGTIAFFDVKFDRDSAHNFLVRADSNANRRNHMAKAAVAVKAKAPVRKGKASPKKSTARKSVAKVVKASARRPAGRKAKAR